MKKPIIIIIVLVVLGGLVWLLGGKKEEAPITNSPDGTIPAVPVSETTKVSDKLSEYRNEELGFSIKYPSIWEVGASNSAVVMVIPTEKSGPNTMKKLEAKVQVVSGKCTFPPVTTIKERNTLKSGDLTFNMISMSNSVQSTNYFDRMYSLQRDNVCYVFSFSSVSVNPTSQGYKGSEATQMANNNKAIIESADQAFTAMVKSFTYVQGPEGKDETQVSPTKK